MEALAFIWIGLAVLWKVLLLLTDQIKFKKYLYLTFIATALLVLTKYSYYLFGANYPFFYWLKIMIMIGLTVITILLSWMGLSSKVNETIFPETLRKPICMAGILLPLAGSIDYFLIKDKFSMKE